LTEDNVKEFNRRFDVDTEGFRNQMGELKPFRLVQEIIANSFDEDPVSRIDCSVAYNSDKKQVEVQIIDDGDGFRNFEDSFKIFGRSYKRRYRNKRGKFNLGDKEFFAVSHNGFVRSRNWKVEFFDDKRIERKNLQPFKGTKIFGTFEWTKKQLKEMLVDLDKIIVPQNQDLYINGELVEKKIPIRKIKGKLWTEDEDQKTKKMVRVLDECEVQIYEKKLDEIAWIFEMGIPVQQLEEGIEMLWHIDILQKVPLGIKRDTVSDSYLIDLYALLVTNCHDLIHKDDSGAKFINRSMSKVNLEVAQEIFKKQYGTDKLYVPTDTADYHANEKVNQIHGEFIKPRTLSRLEKKHLSDIGAIKYALDEFGSGISKEYKVIPPNETMISYANVVIVIAKEMINKDITVDFCNSDISHSAWYDGNKIVYNLRFLPHGRKFFDKFSPEGVGIIAHELSHDKVPAEMEYPMPHCSPEFLSEIERISGKLILADFSQWIAKAQKLGKVIQK
jgi:hypothetical protein